MLKNSPILHANSHHQIIQVQRLSKLRRSAQSQEYSLAMSVSGTEKGRHSSKNDKRLLEAVEEETKTQKNTAELQTTAAVSRPNFFRLYY